MQRPERGTPEQRARLASYRRGQQWGTWMSVLLLLLWFVFIILQVAVTSGATTEVNLVFWGLGAATALFSGGAYFLGSIADREGNLLEYRIAWDDLHGRYQNLRQLNARLNARLQWQLDNQVPQPPDHIVLSFDEAPAMQGGTGPEDVFLLEPVRGGGGTLTQAMARMRETRISTLYPSSESEPEDSEDPQCRTPSPPV